MPLDWTYTWAICVTGVVLVTASVTDVRRGMIYNWLTYPACLVGLVGHWIVGGLTGEANASIGLTGSLLGLAVGFGPMLIAWLAGGINGGDAKLMGAVGALTGWQFTLSAMFYGFAAAALISVVVMIRRRIFLATMKRILRFLYLSFSPNRPADPSTPESPMIPFGLALCIGSAVACVEFFLLGKDAFAWPFGG